MVKRLTMDDWDNIQKQQPSRYYVQSIEDGPVDVEFDSEIVCVDQGDEDFLGNVWDKEWSKNEAKVFIDGDPKIYSLGGTGWSFITQFISVCKKNGLTPEDIPGSVFRITKTGDWEQEIEYIGRASEGGKIEKKEKELGIDDNKVKEIKETLSDLKENSPDILKGGFKEADFVKVITIRSNLKSRDVKKLIPELEKQDIINTKDDRIFVINK
jgi:hypothetical protein